MWARIGWVGIVAAGIGSGACGAPSSPSDLSIAVPWLLEGELSCPNAAVGLSGMTAALHVSGGNPVCPLTVDGQYAVSGQCTGYAPPAEQSFLLISYNLPLPGPPAELPALAYALTIADLRQSSLPRGEEVAVVPVDFTRNDLIIDQSELDGWGQVIGHDCRAPVPPSLEDRAKRWAWCYIQSNLGGAGLACADLSTPLSRACDPAPFTSCYGP